MVGKLPCERLDDFEHFGDLTLVVREHHTLCQHIRNNKQSFQRHIPQLDRPSGLNLIIHLAGERDGCGLLLETGELAADPRLQSGHKTRFVFRQKADQHRDAIAKKNGNSGLADPDRQRDRRKRLTSNPIVLILSPT